VLQTVCNYGETVFPRGRMYQYPFGLMKSPRFALSGKGVKMRRLHFTASTGVEGRYTHWVETAEPASSAVSGASPV
jgi:hypothetical protein